MRRIVCVRDCEELYVRDCVGGIMRGIVFWRE